MTKRKTLTKQVRALMASTHERYTTALAKLTQPRVPVVEVAAPFTEVRIPHVVCRVRWWPSAGEPTKAALEGVSGALRAMQRKPAAVLITRAAFLNEAPDAEPMHETARHVVEDLRQLAAGVRGFSTDCKRVAIDLLGRSVVLSISVRPQLTLSVVALDELLAGAPLFERLASMPVGANLWAVPQAVREAVHLPSLVFMLV